MKNVGTVVAAIVLAGAVAGCADPYYPRYGYSQTYYYPSGYTYYPSGYRYYPASYYRSSTWGSRYDYYRNYRGIHPGPELSYM